VEHAVPVLLVEILLYELKMKMLKKRRRMQQIRKSSTHSRSVDEANMVIQTLS